MYFVVNGKMFYFTRLKENRKGLKYLLVLGLGRHKKQLNRFDIGLKYA